MPSRVAKYARLGTPLTTTDTLSSGIPAGRLVGRLKVYGTANLVMAFTSPLKLKVGALMG